MLIIIRIDKVSEVIPVTSTLPSSPSYEKDDSTVASSAATEYFDPKERSKERKKNVEMNRTDDKRSNAMAALKAKREGKQRREEEEAKRQAEREGNEDLDSGKMGILLNCMNLGVRSHLSKTTFFLTNGFLIIL